MTLKNINLSTDFEIKSFLNFFLFKVNPQKTMVNLQKESQGSEKRPSDKEGSEQTTRVGPTEAKYTGWENDEMSCNMEKLFKKNNAIKVEKFL